ncbi:MAG TPA: MmgE/PrpD family protein [Baekduia sp.]
MNATERIASFVSGAPAALPQPVVEAAKVAILDGVANLVAGSVQPLAGVVRPYANHRGGTPESVVVGQAQRLPAPLAAWVNGAFLHCLDYEIQGYPSAHGTSSILPAALALADKAGASGAELITAYALGWDVQQRMRTAGVHADLRGFHPPGVVGPLGAAAAAARILRLDAEQTLMALGYAASHTGGLFANNGTMTKATHPAAAASAGVEAAELVALGLTANPSVLEDPRGHVAAFFGAAFDWDVLLDGLGERYHLVDPGFSIKPYPAEIYMQWPIDAARELRAREGIDPERVVSVVVEPPVFRADLSRPRPRSGLDGKFSYEYCVAVALTQDAVTIDAFTDVVCHSAPVARMLERITLRENPDIPSDKATTWARVTVTLDDGRELQGTCTRYPGAIGRPMAREQHLVKVEDCLRAGGAGDRASGLIDLVADLENLPDVRALTERLGAVRDG